MRLSKNETPTPMPYPLQNDSAQGQEALAEVLGTDYRRNGTVRAASPSSPAIADLLDLVANHRRDLLKTLLAALSDSEPTREHAEQLMGLVADCGLTESASPCVTAMSIAADLERLAVTSSQWSHPAQVVKNPDPQALYKLCTARLERESGAARERLVKIHPRLERTARLAQKAATRRNQSQNTARQSTLVDQWL